MKQKTTIAALKRGMMITLTMIVRVKNEIPTKNYQKWRKIQPVQEKEIASVQLWMKLHQKRKTLWC